MAEGSVGKPARPPTPSPCTPTRLHTSSDTRRQGSAWGRYQSPDSLGKPADMGWRLAAPDIPEVERSAPSVAQPPATVSFCSFLLRHHTQHMLQPAIRPCAHIYPGQPPGEASVLPYRYRSSSAPNASMRPCHALGRVGDATTREAVWCGGRKELTHRWCVEWLGFGQMSGAVPHPPAGSQPSKGAQSRTRSHGRHVRAAAAAAPRLVVSLRSFVSLAAAGTATAAAAAVMFHAAPVHAGASLRRPDHGKPWPRRICMSPQGGNWVGWSHRLKRIPQGSRLNATSTRWELTGLNVCRGGDENPDSAGSENPDSAVLCGHQRAKNSSQYVPGLPERFTRELKRVGKTSVSTRARDGRLACGWQRKQNQIARGASVGRHEP
jgi:hypothetical protein